MPDEPEKPQATTGTFVRANKWAYNTHLELGNGLMRDCVAWFRIAHKIISLETQK
jgi:hypothetical protein